MMPKQIRAAMLTMGLALVATDVLAAPAELPSFYLVAVDQGNQRALLRLVRPEGVVTGTSLGQALVMKLGGSYKVDGGDYKLSMLDADSVEMQAEGGGLIRLALAQASQPVRESKAKEPADEGLVIGPGLLQEAFDRLARHHGHDFVSLKMGTGKEPLRMDKAIRLEGKNLMDDMQAFKRALLVNGYVADLAVYRGNKTVVAGVEVK